MAFVHDGYSPRTWGIEVESACSRRGLRLGLVYRILKVDNCIGLLKGVNIELV